MSLRPGSRLGPYETIAQVGAGGMGDVYRAKDTRLGRDVAIKTSKEAFDDRFQREARAIASLNHSNICTLYDVGPDYLVMEFIEGQTLSDRIQQGPLPEPEALSIAMQVASALEAAHDKGIVHRDLKPANIKITPGGQVKVLDFGLAKNIPELDAVGSPVESPTFTAHLATGAGVILGTAAYMAPEQARSQGVDKRADIWAFGVVLWEMLTGRRPFGGNTATDSLASILKDDPAWQEVPPRVRPLLRRCLEKDPRKRLHDIADARLWLEEPPLESVPAPAAKASRLPAIMLAVGLLSLTTALALVLGNRWRRGDALPSLQFALTAAANLRFATNGAISVSPDGHAFAVVTVEPPDRTVLYLHRLETGTVTRLTGTEGALYPFWSPDGKYVAFIAAGQLRRADLSGGPPRVLCEDAPAISQGDWGANGSIILAFGNGVWRIPETGGPAERLTTVDSSRGEVGHGSPQWLPGGKQFLYYMLTADPRTRGTYLASLADPGSRKLVIVTNNKVRYAPAAGGRPEALLYLRDQALYAQTFDSSTGLLSGDAVLLATPVVTAGGMSGNAEFSNSASGLLVYRLGDPAANRRLVWMGRDGRRLQELPRRNRFSSLFLSPDASKATVDVRNESGVHDVWIYDLALNTFTPQTSDEGNDFLGVWSPDASRLVFGSSRKGTAQLYLTPVGGGGQEQRITDGAARRYPLQWTRDGKYILFRSQDPNGRNELWALEIDGDRKPFPVVQTKFSQFAGQISPDGRWIAYQSTDTGSNEIYAQRFRAAGPRFTLSSSGGRWAKWRADGKELYYVSGDDVLTAIGVDSSAETLQPTTPPKPLLRTSFPSDLTHPYDVSSDGAKVLIVEHQEESTGVLQVMTNWRSRIKQP